MKQVWQRVRPKLRPIGVVAAFVVLALIAANGYRVAASKHTDGELTAERNAGYNEGFDVGESTGEEEGEAAAKQAARKLRGKSYWNGWGDGWDDGWEGAVEELAPENVNLFQNYIVTYERDEEGSIRLHNWLEMPLGTTWRCDDFERCVELLE